MNDQDQLFTVKKVVDTTGYTDRTVRRWIADGRLPAYRVGPRGIRIKAADLDNFLRLIPVGE